MGNGADDRLRARAKHAEARANGYEPQECRECGNWTLVRNGTAFTCDTCGTEMHEVVAHADALAAH